MTSRTLFAIPAAICAALLAYGYYLQYAQDLNPCPLCLLQRGFFFSLLFVFAVAAVHGQGQLFYSIGSVVLALGGATVAARQVWLQHLPPDKVPQCGPDLFFMLENFPLSRTWQKLIEGTGECAAVDWTFLGLSIAGWSLVWFVLLGGYAAWLAWRARRATAAA